jgi:hypothetical protein
MSATCASNTTVRRGVAAAALAAGLALTGCQAAASNHPAPAPAEQPPQAPAGIDTARPADRVAEIIERSTERNRELSERFEGVPADRVAETLAREAEAAQR